MASSLATPAMVHFVAATLALSCIMKMKPAPRNKPGAHEQQRLEHLVGQDARQRDVVHELQADACEDLLDDERPAKLQAADDGERLQVAHEDHARGDVGLGVFRVPAHEARVHAHEQRKEQHDARDAATPPELLPQTSSGVGQRTHPRPLSSTS
jgi:hypothetical protein